MDKIIIFKSDMVGDLINFSPCLKIIKDNIKNSHITLVCSEYNFQVAKNYSYVDKYVIFNKGRIIKYIFSNFKIFYLTKYKYLFQFDGKRSSYLISYFIKANIRSTICFVKHKKFLGISYQILRPTKTLLKLFFNNFIYCDEKYSNDKKIIHYQANYFDILKKLNFKITSKKNLFFLDKAYNSIYESFYVNNIKNKFYLFHFDDKWDRYKPKDYINSLKIIKKISTKNKLIITTGIKNFSFLKDLEEKFYVYNFIENNITLETKSSTKEIIVLKNLPLNLLAYFIKNSEKNISSHSGPIVHISPSFEKMIIDIIPKIKNDELDRWVPIVSNYQRINFEDITDEFIENFKF